MTTLEQVFKDVKTLNETELKDLADYLAFLKFRSKTPSLSDEATWAALYAEFAEEDRQLAEQGMADYSASLAKEDA